MIPAIGPILVIGTLGTILLNAAGGAAIAGLAGALVGWGIPEHDAKYYESEVQAGRFLVTVDRGTRTNDPLAVFTRHGGYDRATAPCIIERMSGNERWRCGKLLHASAARQLSYLVLPARGVRPINHPVGRTGGSHAVGRSAW